MSFEGYRDLAAGEFPLSSNPENRKLELLARKVRERMIGDFWKLLDERDIRSFLIKGWAASINYPEPSERDLGDIDVVVSEKDCGVVADFPGLARFAVDLHCGPRHLDSSSFDTLYGNSVEYEIGGSKVRIPCPEDHLRILCVHWLTDGGERKERLWDIYWAVKNRPQSFDWDKCLSVVSERRQRWIICTIGLAHRYLGLPVDDLPFRKAALELPVWLTRAIEKRWKSGVVHFPIHRVVRDRKAFLQQLRKRFPPNPVMATINMEGDIDAFTRLHYQAGHILKQSLPSFRRIWRTFGQGRN